MEFTIVGFRRRKILAGQPGDGAVEPGGRQVGQREDAVQNRDGCGGAAGLDQNGGLEVQARHVIRRHGQMRVDELQGVGEITKSEISAHHAVHNLRVIGMLLQNGLEDAAGVGGVGLRQPGVRLQQGKFHIQGAVRRKISGLILQMIYQRTRQVGAPEPGVKIRQGEYRRGRTGGEHPGALKLFRGLQRMANLLKRAAQQITKDWLVERATVVYHQAQALGISKLAGHLVHAAKSQLEARLMIGVAGEADPRGKIAGIQLQRLLETKPGLVPAALPLQRHAPAVQRERTPFRQQAVLIIRRGREADPLDGFPPGGLPQVGNGGERRQFLLPGAGPEHFIRVRPGRGQRRNFQGIFPAQIHFVNRAGGLQIEPLEKIAVAGMQIEQAVGAGNLFEQLPHFQRGEFMPVFAGQPAHGPAAFESGAVGHRRQRFRVHRQPVPPVGRLRQDGLKHLQFLRLVAQHHAAPGGQGFDRQFTEDLQRMKIQMRDGRNVSRRQTGNDQDEAGRGDGNGQLPPLCFGPRMFALRDRAQCNQQEIAREKTRAQGVQIIECQHRQRNAELALHNLPRPGGRVERQPQTSQQQRHTQAPVKPEHDQVLLRFERSALAAEPHQTGQRGQQIIKRHSQRQRPVHQPELIVKQQDRVLGRLQTGMPGLGQAPGRVRRQTIEERQQCVKCKPRQPQPGQPEQKFQSEQTEPEQPVRFVLRLLRVILLQEETKPVQPDYAADKKRQCQQHEPILRHAQPPDKDRRVNPAGFPADAIFEQQPE